MHYEDVYKMNDSVVWKCCTDCLHWFHRFSISKVGWLLDKIMLP